MASMYDYECDTGVTPLIVYATKVEPVKESDHEKVVKNNAIHAARFHRGDDGQVRQLCGPRISSLMGRSKTSCTTCLLNSGGIFGRSVYGRGHMESKTVRACLITERSKRKVGYKEDGKKLCSATLQENTGD